MTAWFARNTTPILIVLVAAGVVIGAFEVLDALTTPTPSAETAASAEPAGEELEGVASIAGLIKVMLFLAVSGGITLAVRRRQRTST